MSKTYLGLIKLGAKEHMFDLYDNGHVYLNTFEYFRTAEVTDDGRADRHEYITNYHSGKGLDLSNFILTARLHTGEVITIPLSRTGGTKSITMNCLDKRYSHLFCMSLIDKDWIVEYGTILDPANVAPGKNWMLIVHNIPEFNRRLKLAIVQAGFGRCEARPIEYINAENYSGEVGCFKKFDAYSHQQEWRLAIDCPNKVEPQHLYLGTLADIAIRPFPAEQMYEGLVQIVGQSD